MYLPFGWENMTASTLDQYLASHSQAEIKAENDKRIDAALRNRAPQQPTGNATHNGNAAHGEEVYTMPTMNGLFGDGLQYGGGGGRLMETPPPQPASQPSYFGAAGGAVSGRSEPEQHGEEVYTMPELCADWGTRLRSLGSSPANNQVSGGAGVPASEVSDAPLMPVMNFDRKEVQANGGHKANASQGPAGGETPLPLPKMF